MAGLTPKQERTGSFYVYHLIDPRDGKVFYVGKGSGKRAWRHEVDAVSRRMVNLEKEALIRDILRFGLKYQVAKVYERCTEAEAFALEAAEIKRIGYGNLTNIEKNPSAGVLRSFVEGRTFIALMRSKLRSNSLPQAKQRIAISLIKEMNENLTLITRQIGTSPIAIAMSYGG